MLTPGRQPLYVRIVNTPRAFLTIVLAWVAACSAVFDLAERHNFWNSLYWAVVTGSSTGYGDLTPHTMLGRGVTAAFIVSMVFFVVPLITAQFASKLIVDRDAWTDEEQEQVKNDLKDCKAELAEVKQQLADVIAMLNRRERAT